MTTETIKRKIELIKPESIQEVEYYVDFLDLWGLWTDFTKEFNDSGLKDKELTDEEMEILKTNHNTCRKYLRDKDLCPGSAIDDLRNVTVAWRLFKESKVILTAGESPTLFKILQQQDGDLEPERTIALYQTQFMIQKNDDDLWEVIIDRTIYTNSNLEKLERRLFDWLCKEWWQIC